MELYKDQFDSKYDLISEENDSRKYLIIASTARSGSHMLGHALHDTGQFGYPLEYVNPSNLEQWKKITQEDSFEGVLNSIKSRRTSSNGVFAIKVHYSHIKQFGSFQNFTKHFPEAHVILITRKNVLKQAVSFVIASQSGNWISGQTSKIRKPVYDGNRIKMIMKRTMLENASWRYNLLTSGSNFLEMEFETISANIPQAVKEVASFMEVDIAHSSIPAKPVTKRQSSIVNEEWEKKFLEQDFSGEDISSDLRRMYEGASFRGQIKKLVRKIKKIYRIYN